MKAKKCFRENILTVKENAPVIQVHLQKDIVMLASVSGASGILAILDDKVLDQLYVLSRKAKAEVLSADGNARAVTELCETLDGVLKTYRMMRDEYFHRLEIEAERDDAEQRLQEAINAIQNAPAE